MFQKILLAISESPESADVLESGLTLAEKLGAQILILHVLNPLVPHGLAIPASPLVGGILPIVNDVAVEQYLVQWKAYEQSGIERLQSYLAQAVSRGVKAEVLQNYGDSGPLICTAAKDWAADSIVMGRREGQSMLSEIFLGSTSNYVLHHAHCSVTVIQSPARSN